MYTLILFLATVTGDDHSVVYWSLSAHHTHTLNLRKVVAHTDGEVTVWYFYKSTTLL